MAECGITNLAGCIAQSFFDFLMSLINAPIQPLLNMVSSLLTQPVNIEIFSNLWSIIVYILSMFYGLLLMYVGFKFMISGYSPEQREKAKTDLANIIIMMVLIQSSFYIYSLIIDIGASLSSTIVNLIPQNFFLLTIDNITNMGLEISLIVPYLASVLITLVLLTIRYILVSLGVLFFPVAIFFYFIAPLKSYGKLLMNLILVAIGLTFFYSLIFLASSNLLDVGIFSDVKILVMIGAFMLVNAGTLILALFVIIQGAMKIIPPIMKIVSTVGSVVGS